MAAPGPKPKSTAAKKMGGNPGKRPLNADEPVMPVPPKAPKPPAYLNTAGKKEWKRVAPILLQAGILTTGDLSALEAYCIQYGALVEAQKALKKNGGIMETSKDEKGKVLTLGVHPMFDVQQKALVQMRQFMSEFGLTPSSRSRIKVAAPKQTDDFGDFLSGK